MLSEDSPEKSRTARPAAPGKARGTRAAVTEAAEDADSSSKWTEEEALALLKQTDLSPEIFEKLHRNQGLMARRKVRLATVQHPRAPRHVVVPVMRHLFTFELMQTGLKPSVSAEVRRLAEEVLIGRLETISSGERLSLARRASGRVAGALLSDPEERVMRAALENGRVTESSIVKALNLPGCPAALVHAVCRHERWWLRVEIQMALLRNENTPLSRVLKIARSLPEGKVREVLRASALPERIKEYLRQEFEEVAGR